MIVKPFCYVSCGFTSLFMLTICFILFFNPLFNLDIYFALVDGAMLLPLYSLLLPFIIKQMSDRFKEKSNNVFQQHIMQSNSTKIGDVYFDSFAQAWRRS